VYILHDQTRSQASAGIQCLSFPSHFTLPPAAQEIPEIGRVDPGWSDAIPATLIYNRESRVFLEQELTREELFSNVHQILN